MNKNLFTFIFNSKKISFKIHINEIIVIDTKHIILYIKYYNEILKLYQQMSNCTIYELNI